MKLDAGAWLRYVLWLAVLNTANANRKKFGFATSWVFHAAFNTGMLLLPELYGALSRVLRLDERAAKRRDAIAVGHQVMRDVVLDNPMYVGYVAPPALGSALAHPQFNIYRGSLGEIEVLGFGLDALPHFATSFALTRFVQDTLDALEQHTPTDASGRELVEWAKEQERAVSAAAMLGASAFYEGGEYLIHEDELRRANGDAERIQMQWSARNTVFDLLANLFGWLTALRFRSRRAAHANGEGADYTITPVKLDF